MKQSFVFYFFKFTVFTLEFAAVFPKKRVLKSQLRMFLLYKVWPVACVMIWVPLVPMVFLKAMQFQSNKDWDKLLDITHKFIVGCFTLYMMCVVHVISVNFMNIMATVEEKFRTKHEIPVREFLPIILLWVTIPMIFMLQLVGCVFYKEIMVPLWIPFVDNNKELSSELVVGVWTYQLMFSVYIFINFTVWGPFIIVSTICICKELDCLVGAVDRYGSTYVADVDLQQETEGSWCSDTLFRRRSPSRQDMVRFVGEIVQHHITITSAISNVNRIHNYVFLVQTIAAVVLSCVLTFNLYYTAHVEKVIFMSTPILFTYYYLMFAYCLNGQNLTDKEILTISKIWTQVWISSHELALALYRLPWYNCPRSYRTSMLIMMEVLKRPVYLRGGGIMRASLATFITCLQQTCSYILILKAMTPEKKSS